MFHPAGWLAESSALDPETEADSGGGRYFLRSAIFPYPVSISSDIVLRARQAGVVCLSGRQLQLLSGILFLAEIHTNEYCDKERNKEARTVRIALTVMALFTPPARKRNRRRISHLGRETDSGW